MTFLFWSLTLFGDNEWMQGKIHNFIFSKNVDNFFYICSFFVAPLCTVTFPSCWFWDTIQSWPTYRCTTFWSPNLLNKLLEFSAFAMPCSQVFVLLLIQLLSGLGAISCTRFSAPNHHSHQGPASFIYSFKNTKQNSNYSRIFEWYWQIIIWSTNCWIFFRIFVISTHAVILKFLYFVNLCWALSRRYLKSFTSFFSNSFRGL